MMDTVTSGGIIIITYSYIDKVNPKRSGKTRNTFNGISKRTGNASKKVIYLRSRSAENGTHQAHLKKKNNN